MDATTTITTGYEVVSVDISVDAGTCTTATIDDSGDVAVTISATVSAPSGKKVVGGGYNLGGPGAATNTAPFFVINGPSSDGTSWQLASGGTLEGGEADASTVWGTVYAICMAV